MSKLQRRKRQLLNKGLTPEATRQATKGIAKILQAQPQLTYKQASELYFGGRKKTSQLGKGYDEMMKIFKKYNIKHKSGYEEYLEGVYSPEEYSNTLHEAVFDAWDTIDEFKRLAAAELQKAHNPDDRRYWNDVIHTLDRDSASLETYMNMKYY